MPPSRSVYHTRDSIHGQRPRMGLAPLLIVAFGIGVAIFIALSVILTPSVKALEYRLASWRPETAKTF